MLEPMMQVRSAMNWWRWSPAMDAARHAKE
jgi:hypothetical protein